MADFNVIAFFPQSITVLKSLFPSAPERWKRFQKQPLLSLTASSFIVSGNFNSFQSHGSVTSASALSFLRFGELQISTFFLSHLPCEIRDRREGNKPGLSS